MSSGSSGRYQSRLFNFVHQQSRRLTQQWGNSFRHLQVATKWGVELLLYPVYLLFQSSEADAKTLHTKEPQSRLNLPSNDTDFQPENHLNVDTPIEQVLETVYYLSSEEVVATPKQNSQSFNPLSFLGIFWQKSISKNSTDTNIIHSPTITDRSTASIQSSSPENSLKQHLATIQGVATNLLNRNLVLVTTGNEILDILTPQQQAKLEEKIINEVARYWQSWRLIQAQKDQELLPQIDGLLAKLTGENPVKIPILPGTTSNNSLNSSKLFTFLDLAVATVESKALIPVQQGSQKIIQVAQTQLNVFIYGKEQLTAKGKMAVAADDIETHTFNVQALIEAALNYFFGVRNRKTLESTIADNQQNRLLFSYPKKALFKNRNLPNQDLTNDPWLTWSDLFGNGEKVTEKAVPIPENTTPALAASLSTGIFWPKNLHRQQPKAKSELVQRKKITRHLTSIRKTFAKVTSFQKTQKAISQVHSKTHKGEISQQRFSQTTEVEAQPDWIETKATTMGYEKHPLEKILEWLDAVILWLEEIFAKLFQSLQRVWQGNK
ncbi:hypothetical protein VF14_05405 [Nostoc linckia z18]|uniref:Uncharacterized protein n=2 Tax=Nostoc linckia TaxID=92942 RepID=A0A9Q5ZF63_NOSLI|nr:hypothetical protein [Nostoc linckia]PHK41929.1 hypothetical protein VF12_04800 [Nostoc linckia z15]PHK46662.1 hypothetical protein VF13_09515 [Nostoc linckia z16]PHJ67502.1 hypothetical protein VF02_04755 [Nostoc linckia z1]PHJ72526.1 hypothetical protein VF05_03715 [Nostoc linckia z3]PHJ74868.1 hypothetical protein VF03_12530 [Nostoc linckia z2]